MGAFVLDCAWRIPPLFGVMSNLNNLNWLTTTLPYLTTPYYIESATLHIDLSPRVKFETGLFVFMRFR